MIISLDKLIRKEIDKLDLSFLENVDTIRNGEYKLSSPLKVEGKISNTNKGLYLDIEVEFTFVDNCSRCLKEVQVPIKYSVQGFLVKDNFDEEDFEEDIFVFNGFELDIMDIIEQTIDFEIPLKVLCSEDCKGLCQYCGTNLNIEKCSCNEVANDEDIIDPRFAKLKDIFKND